MASDGGIRVKVSGEDGPQETLAVYGTLRRGLTQPDFPRGLAGMLRYRSPCLLAGWLYDLGAFPGLVTRPDGGRVHGELYDVLDRRAFALLDAYEHYDSGNPGASLYLRQRVRLLEPEGEAWVYVYNRPVLPSACVASGDWGRRGPDQG